MSHVNTPADAPRRAGVSTRTRAALLVLIVAVAVAAVVALLEVTTGTSNDAVPRITVAPTQQGAPNAAATGEAGFDRPSGFTTSRQFRPSTPLYTPYGGTYLQFEATPKRAQVLAVVIYDLSATQVPNDATRRLAFVASVDRRIQANVTRPSSATTVDGNPAITQDGSGSASAGGVTSSYDYRTWFVFRRPTSLVQVTCQWSTNRTAVLAGCNQLVGSLDISS